MASTVNIFKALKLCAKELGGELQVNTLLAFLIVAQRGTCTQKDVEVELGTTNASASRNVSYWTERRFDREPGMGYIERVQDDYDRRIRNLTLTQQGKAFLRRLENNL